MESGMKKVVGLVTDLMFIAKIQDATRRAGFDPVFVKTPEQAFEQSRANSVALILDLNSTATRPLEAIQKMKASAETKAVRVIGFSSHVESELRQAAKESGCDVVLARSNFSQKLPVILASLL
jgi:PleD family two-component response regulator